MSSLAGERWDVVILGGGPAGSAAALDLRARRSSLSVLVLEASSYERPRLGEMLPGAAQSLLRQLGVLGAFEAERFVAAHASAAAWGSRELVENHFLFSARGPGWHLDRARFDAMLAREAERRGARVRRGDRPSRIDPSPGGWQVTFADGAVASARFIIDATGRKATFSRAQGARFQIIDRLAGFARFLPSAPGSDPRTLVEAFSDGWWYTAPLPGGIRVVSCMTDVDIGRSLGLPGIPAWQRMLAETTWIKHAVEVHDTGAPCLSRPADSKVLHPMCGPGWLAAGDAAMAFDPLSSQGITRALRSGILASFAAGDCLIEPPGGARTERYEALHRRELTGYLRAHEGHFLDERRFGDREFWRRRHLRTERAESLAGDA